MRMDTSSCSLADHAMKDDVVSSLGNPEAITGSGSLLPSSESDHWGARHLASWKPMESTSPTVSSSHTNHSSTSPMRRQSSNQLVSPAFVETNPGNSYFPLSSAAMNQGINGKQPRKIFLDPVQGNFAVFDQPQMSRPSRHNSEEENRYSVTALAVGNGDVSFKAPAGRQPFHTQFSGYNSSAASRSGSTPPSRNGAELSARFVDEPVNNPYKHLVSGSSSHRQNLSAHSSYSNHARPYTTRYAEQSSPAQMGILSGEFNKMNIGRENQNPYSNHQKEPATTTQKTLTHEYHHQHSVGDIGEAWTIEENGYNANHDPFMADSISGTLTSHLPQYRDMHFNANYSHSPVQGEIRHGQQSSFYPTMETPSALNRIPKGVNNFSTTNGQAAVSDRKLRALQQIQPELSGYHAHPSRISFRPTFPPSYEFHPQSTLPMNPLAPYYHMPSLLTPSAVPRGPAREHDISQNVRSPLLEEFRNNSKTNKRYELKASGYKELIRKYF